ncbi:MAG TPA: guanosine monophosphate reductase [Candidatus Nanoarchaeia archaeon]|nr:guanosine monophosphate reductase [Candidatus Nanoarchaeia archaeon]
MARIISKGHSFEDVLIVPKYNKIVSRKEVSLKTKVTKNYEIEIPLIVANMDTTCEAKMAIAIGKLGGLGVIHRFNTIKQQAEQVKLVKKHKLLAAAAIGVKDYERRLGALIKANIDIIVLDIAHGHSKYAGKVVEYIKKKYPEIDVMAGNIATKDAAEYFLSKGADAIKVGIGPGSMCTTRIMTGAGVPQLTAIMDVYEATQGRIPICADGGIKNPGDFCKALGAGANTVMSGSIFAGTDESPGKVIKKKGKKFKLYRGMASYEATLKKKKLDGKESKEIISVEGEKTFIPYKGPIEPIVKKFLGGLTSGMTYIGAKNMENFIGKVDFIEISSAGYKESIAHGVREFH